MGSSDCKWENLNLLTALGGDRPVNYKNEKFGEVLKEIYFVFDTLDGSVKKKVLEY